LGKLNGSSTETLRNLALSKNPSPADAAASAIAKEMKQTPDLMAIEVLDGVIESPLRIGVAAARQRIVDPRRPGLLFKDGEYGNLVEGQLTIDLNHLSSKRQLPSIAVEMRLLQNAAAQMPRARRGEHKTGSLRELQGRQFAEESVAALRGRYFLGVFEVTLQLLRP
jgi:hypothetical protein